jgi:Domain of unknown function (DUF397)
MEMTKAPTWRTSSYSGSGGGNCVEAGAVPGAILVRDTKDRSGPVLAFGQQAWQAFAADVKAAG